MTEPKPSQAKTPTKAKSASAKASPSEARMVMDEIESIAAKLLHYEEIGHLTTMQKYLADKIQKLRELI